VAERRRSCGKEAHSTGTIAPHWDLTVVRGRADHAEVATPGERIGLDTDAEGVAGLKVGSRLEQDERPISLVP
jgi:hypothetical protein